MYIGLFNNFSSLYCLATGALKVEETDPNKYCERKIDDLKDDNKFCNLYNDTIC